MQALTRFAVTLVAAGSLAAVAYAGPEALPDSKEVASVAPPACEWSGFYIGAAAGGQFGHSEDKDLDNYNFPDRPWGYHEDGVSVSEQLGFNWQFGHFVFGPEVEAGYMNLKGSGIEPGIPGDTFGKTHSDLFTTFRGRVGVAFGCWMFYATGGGIGVNETTQVIDTTTTRLGPDRIDAHREDFNLGYTVGGGVEHMFNIWGHRWSIKAEYLYYNLDNQGFSATSANGFGPYHWNADTEGHIVRAGFNYHF